MKLQWKYYVIEKALTLENRDYYCNPITNFKPENCPKNTQNKVNDSEISFFSLANGPQKYLVTELKIYKLHIFYIIFTNK